MAACLVVLLNPRFEGPEWRGFRLGTFLWTGFSALIPIAHGIWRFGLEQMHTRGGLGWYVVEGACYALGAGFYSVSTLWDVEGGRG